MYIDELIVKYPCRDGILKQLHKYIGCFAETLPPAIYMFGHNGIGKSTITKAVLENLNKIFVYVDCIECYTPKILFESIVDALFSHKLQAAENYAPYEKCKNGADFVNTFNELDATKSYIILLDNVERLQNMNANILPLLMRIGELTGLNICCIFISTVLYDYMLPIGNLREPLTIYWPQYTKDEIKIILLSKFEEYKEILLTKLKKVNHIDIKEIVRRINIIEKIETDFFQNYINIFLNIFFRTSRELNQLMLISQDYFEKYCQPIFEDLVDVNDVRKLYANISPALKSTLVAIYKSIDQANLNNTTILEKDSSTSNKTNYQLELPYYAKYLLIAAYLASHNDKKSDKRLFMKHHGKQKKRLQAVNAKAKVSEKFSTQLGPKSFHIDRLLAIFYAILDEKVSLTCTLLAQVSSLVNLKLLCYVSGENNIMDGTARLQCTVSLDFIKMLGNMVGFNVCNYLNDFI